MTDIDWPPTTPLRRIGGSGFSSQFSSSLSYAGARLRVASRPTWLSALALFDYAAAFSFSYSTLSAATGALILFGAVQAAMIGGGLLAGERLPGWQLLGFAVAFIGLVGLLLPGLSAPSLRGSALTLAASVAWGIYSLRARG